MTAAAERPRYLPADWELPVSIRERLGDAPGRQRAMSGEGHLLLVLHRPPQADETERHPRLFWRTPEGIWKSSELGAGFAALSHHLTEFAELIEQYDRQETAAQNVRHYRVVLEAMAPLQRTARNLHVALQEARNMVPHDHDLINARDQAYAIERNAELLYQEIQNSIELIAARQAEEQAADAHEMALAAHRLNMLVAFFFPVATLATVFGIGSPKNGLEDAPAPWGFLAVVAIGLILGGLLSLSLRRKPKG